MSPLGLIGQEDFSAGILRSSARDTEPGVGLQTARNGLFDDDGDIYMRGGDDYFDGPGPGPTFTFAWSGYLNGVSRTVLCNETRMMQYIAATSTFSSYGTTPGLAAPTLPAVLGAPPTLGAVPVDHIYLTNGYRFDGTNIPTQWSNLLPAGHQTVEHIAACAGRLCVSHRNEIHFSNQGALVNQPGQPTTFPQFARDDVHVLPDGVHVSGMLAIRDTLLVFTSFGVWAIGNMFYDLVDDLGNVQQTLNRIVPEMSLLHESGLAEWQGQIIVPTNDRVFIMDAQSAPIPVSDSVAPMYAQMVADGHRPRGAKVFRNHYFLPLRIAGNIDTGQMLVCRLNRPVRGRQIYYPWSVIDGHAGSCQALDVRLIDDKIALTGCHLNFLINLGTMFEPGKRKIDFLSGFGPLYTPTFEVELRDLPTGGARQPNHIRFVRVWATIKRWSSASPSENVEISLVDVDGVWRPVGQIASEEGFESPVRLEVDPAIRSRFTRALIVAAADHFEQIRIHKIEFGVRQAAHQR